VDLFARRPGRHGRRFGERAAPRVADHRASGRRMHVFRAHRAAADENGRRSAVPDVPIRR